jgi:hypothetical protein
VVVELFAFWADDFIAMSNEVTNKIVVNSNNENAITDKLIDLRIGSSSP